MKMIKSTLATFAVALGALFAHGAIEEVNGIKWQYEICDGGVGISSGSNAAAINTETAGDVTVPSVLGGFPVVAIDSLAFSGCTGLTSVTILPGVTNIGSCAFQDCRGLASVTIPSSVTSIGAWAFEGCCELKSFFVDDANPNYNAENGLLLTGDGTVLVAGVNGDVIIPSSVKCVMYGAFMGCSGLTNVMIPLGVERIGNGAFEYCSGLASVTIPSSVTNIGGVVFSGCSGLMSFFVDEANPNYKAENGLLLSKDGKTVIAGVNGDVVIPSSVVGVGDDAFLGCSGLTSVTIPSSVTSIGRCAFSDCDGLTDVTIPSSVTNFGDFAFSECCELRSMVIPPSVTSIGRAAFQGCSSLTSVTIPSSVMSIGESAFLNCNGLNAIVVDEGDSARVKGLYAWGNLVVIVEGTGSVTVTFDAMGGDSAMTAIDVACGTAVGELPMATRDGYTFLGWFTADVGGEQVSSETVVTANATYFAHWNKNESGLPETEIVDGVEWTYTVCDGKASVKGIPKTTRGAIVIPASLGGCPVTCIGEQAFYACHGLTSVVIPVTVKSIAACSFLSCVELTSVTIPTNVTSIESQAFSGCRGLTSVTIPSKVTRIGAWAFEGCSGLESFFVDDANPKYKAENGILLTKDGKTVIAGVKGDVIIPSSVTDIGDHAFFCFCGLTSVLMPPSVVSIGEGAFEGCGLTSVEIPSGVTSIGDDAFLGCSGLTSVVIPECVASVGDGAFNYCGGLTSFSVNEKNPSYKTIDGLLLSKDGTRLIAGVNGEVVIPEDVMSIGESAFRGCSGLASVLIPSSVTNIGEYAFSACTAMTSMVIPSSVTSIGTGAFESSGLTSVTIPSSVTNISDCLFLGCSGLTSVVIPEGVTSVGGGAFHYCCGLTSVTIPSSVTNIGEGAFRYCSSLASVMISPSVTSIGGSAFYGCSSLSVVYVGDGDTARIKGMYGWHDRITFVEEFEPAYCVGTKCSLDTGWIGYIVKNLPKGLRYDKKTGIIFGVPTAVTSEKMVATFTKKGKEAQMLEFTVAALPSGATGTFNGFVVSGALGDRALPDDETANVGSLQVTVSDVGKITAKVVAAAGTYSFTATGWDSVNEGVYSVKMTTKKGDVLTLACDSTAAWNDHQLTGSFVASGATALSVEAQKNAFGKQWFFNATGDDANGWTLSFAENAKTAALTVTLNADGKTSVAGKLGAYKITASGYADVSGIGTGAIFADFAPVVTVGKAKKTLTLRANLWFDKKNEHEQGVGSAVFVP